MSWKPAPCGVTLAEQLDQLHPGRLPDWVLGDPAHAQRASDHNPQTDEQGREWVDARDIRDSPDVGLDSTDVALDLHNSRDSRILYVIHCGRMFSSYPAHGYAAWAWRPYKGRNQHRTHVHVSFTDAGRHDTRPWALEGPSTPAPVPAPAPPATKPPAPRPGPAQTKGEPMPPTVRRGDQGTYVARLQGLLFALGLLASADVVGTFGPKTEAAVRKLQHRSGHKQLDGIAGPATWRAALGIKA